MESHFVQTADLRVHYLALGPTDGQPIVFLHGFPETSRQWRHQMTALAAAGYRCYAPDNRGFGQTDKPRIRISRALLGDDVVRFLDAVGITSCHLVGHDWGGIIAFKAAIDHQDRFTSLTLLDTLCTVWAPLAIHGYWFKAEGYAERFFAAHHEAFIRVLFAGADASVLGSMPDSPWPIPSGEREHSSWLTPDDVQHDVDAFADPDVWFHAIQYYRYGLPFHRVFADASATHAERFELLSESEVAALWLHEGGLFASSAFASEGGSTYFDYGPDDRHKTFARPTLWIYGNYLGAGEFRMEGDKRIPTGNPFVDQFSRYFPDLRARAAECGHFIGEEAPEFTNNELLTFLASIATN